MQSHFLRTSLFVAAVSTAIWPATSIAAEIAADAVDLSGHLLQAGPVHLKLQDGQLRYLCVGEKEIVRRIYFGVRDGNWATAMPRYTLMKIDDAGDHFTVQMAAECRMGAVDITWTGTIVGTADGKITFRAEGTPNASFESNRIGLCVLYGTPSLAKQEFHTDGTPAQGIFPAAVSDVHVADQFHKLQYSTDAGLTVACSVDGAIFDMEDQRNWGDSSWKAFAPLPYAYKKVGKGDVKSETVTLMVTGANKADSQPMSKDLVHISIGQAIPDVKIPGLSDAASASAPADFTAISFKRDAFKDKQRIDWSYIPTTHLPDDDTIMENLPTIADQANTILGFASIHPDLHVGPIRLDSKGQDPRGNTPLGAAWLVGMVNFLAQGHVQEASFDLKGELPAAALEAIRPYAHWQVIGVETSPKNSGRLLAFGCVNDHEQVLFLVNCLPVSVNAVFNVGFSEAKVLPVAPGAKEEAVQLPADGWNVQFPPYAVCRVTMPRNANSR